jgi:hypothetical protein
MTWIYERTEYLEIYIVFPQSISPDDFQRLTAIIRSAYNAAEVVQAVREIELKTDQIADISQS